MPNGDALLALFIINNLRFFALGVADIIVGFGRVIPGGVVLLVQLFCGGGGW